VSGTGKRVGAAPEKRSCFSGGTGTGEPEPERCGQSRSFADAGAAKAPEALPRQMGQDRERDRRITILSFAAAVGAPQSKSSANLEPVLEANAGVPEWQCNAGMDTETPGFPSRDDATAPEASANENQPRCPGQTEPQTEIDRELRPVT